MNRWMFHAAWLVGLLCITLPARAALLTSASQIGPGPTVIDFSQFAGTNTLHTTGPVPVGSGVTFTSTNLDCSLLGSGPYSLNDNGSWDSLTMAALDVDAFGGDRYTMTFHFDAPVATVGAFVNYASFPFSGFGDVMIAALNAGGAELESWDLTADAPISTPGGVDQGAFRGIGRNQTDIAFFTLSNSGVAITDLTFSTASSTPEPRGVSLVSVGLLALALLRRRST